MVWAEVEINGKIVQAWVDVRSTINRVGQGIKFPHRHDGAAHKNPEKLLTSKPENYYREYVHPTYGVDMQANNDYLKA